MNSLKEKAEIEKDSLYQKTVSYIAMCIIKHGQYNALNALADGVEMYNESLESVDGDGVNVEELKTGRVIEKLVESLKPLDIDYSNGSIETRRKMVDELKRAILKLEVTE